MDAIKEAIAQATHPTRPVAVRITAFVDLVDSVKLPAKTEVGKEQLAAARKAAGILRGHGGKCCVGADALQTLIDHATAAEQKKPPADKPLPPDPRGSK